MSPAQPKDKTEEVGKLIRGNNWYHRYDWYNLLVSKHKGHFAFTNPQMQSTVIWILLRIDSSFFIDEYVVTSRNLNKIKHDKIIYL